MGLSLRQAVDSVLVFIASAQAKRGDLPGEVAKPLSSRLPTSWRTKSAPERKCHRIAMPARTTGDREERNGPALEANPPSRRGPSVILVVEDHQASRLALCAFLNRRGYRTLEAATAAQALDLVSKHSIDLVISDINLPDGSGHTLMTQLREQYGLNGIATSALGAPEDVARSKASGCVLHITKPVKPDVLERILHLYFALEDAGAFAARGD